MIIYHDLQTISISNKDTLLIAIGDKCDSCILDSIVSCTFDSIVLKGMFVSLLRLSKILISKYLSYGKIPYLDRIQIIAVVLSQPRKRLLIIETVIFVTLVCIALVK